MRSLDDGNTARREMQRMRLLKLVTFFSILAGESYEIARFLMG